MEQHSLTVLELLDRFDQSFPDQDEGTRYMRHLAFSQFVAVCGDVALDDFSFTQCDAYRAALLGGYTPKTPQDLLRLNRCLPSRARQGLLKGFSPVTAASYLKMIRKPFRWWGIRQRQFFDYWSQMEPIKRVRKPVRVYSDGQLGRLLEEARQVQDDGLTEARVLVEATAGLRRAEAQQLLESDIDWDEGTITVQPHAETATTWEWIPKDRDWRTVPLVDQARDALRRRRELLPKEQPYLLQSAERYAVLMYLRSQGQMTARQRKLPDENTRAFKRLRLKAGTAGLSQKHLRSTFATNCLQDGMDIETVRSLMGHSDISVTQSYLKPHSGAIEKARTLGRARLNRLQLAKQGA